MTHVAGLAGSAESPVLHAAIAMAPEIRAASEEIERGRRLPNSIVKPMRDAGIFGMAMPRSWGGPELDPLTQFRVIETLGMADGSVGWCAMINSDGGYVTAFLEDGVGRKMYPDISAPTASAATPTGQAELVPGGYRVSGRFPFVSGSQHSEWAWLGCVVTKNGTPSSVGNGLPETRQCMLPLSQCRILDTWHTTGLRGTGSNDLLVEDVFVDAAHSFSFQDSALVKRPGPLYAFPFLFIGKASAPALGIARHAIDALVDIAQGKAARRYTLGKDLEPPKMMRDDVYVQEAVARAEIMLTAARACQFEVMGSFWESLTKGKEPSPTQMARFMSTATYVIGACAEVVQLVCKAAGGMAVYQKGPFDRCLRDIMTMNQHVVATLRNYEVAGRLILGLEPLRFLL
ncbi:MAG TPA: acyl-CoA dehydrogenase family protein [Acetobacteraceae bacterium]|nr:acyl-CoA dehydrogenase family protein [Acetobacteraceae bacterium]